MEFTEGVRFDSLHLSPEIIRAIEKRNIEVSTPVQAGCIPPMMDWQDVIAKAPTGTGKTFAYGIPIVEHVDPEDESVQAVILAPTRELAIQITDEIRDLAADGVPLWRRPYRLADRHAEEAPPDRGGHAGTAFRPHEAPHRPGGHGADRGAGRGRPDAGHGLHP